MCSMLSVAAPKELRVDKRRIGRFWNLILVCSVLSYRFEPVINSTCRTFPVINIGCVCEEVFRGNRCEVILSVVQPRFKFKLSQKIDNDSYIITFAATRSFLFPYPATSDNSPQYGDFHPTSTSVHRRYQYPTFPSTAPSSSPKCFTV
jgi:hypothetical protein